MKLDPVFINNEYDSYSDYRALIAASGFESCDLGQLDHNRHCAYFISPMNGNVEAYLQSIPKVHTCKVIWWFLERPGNSSIDDFKADLTKHLEHLNVDEIWIADRALYNLVSDISNVKFVMVGSDEALGQIPSNEHVYDYDFCHMAYVWGRRSFLNYMSQKLGPNGWGDARHKTLFSTKFMINVHQDDGSFHEPLRFALCAAYALPMISETCNDPYPYENGHDFIGVPFDQIEKTFVQALSENHSKWREIGKNMWETATKKFRFRDNVINNL